MSGLPTRTHTYSIAVVYTGAAQENRAGSGHIPDTGRFVQSHH